MVSLAPHGLPESVSSLLCKMVTLWFAFRTSCREHSNSFHIPEILIQLIQLPYEVSKLPSSQNS